LLNFNLFKLIPLKLKFILLKVLTFGGVVLGLNLGPHTSLASKKVLTAYCLLKGKE
jgi:hypothetical protein